MMRQGEATLTAFGLVDGFEKGYGGMTDKECTGWWCEDWEEEEHVCANVFCPGCE